LIQISVRCHSHNLRRALFIIACLQSARFADALPGIGAQNLQRVSKATVERAIVGRIAGGAAVRVQGRCRGGVLTDALRKLLTPGKIMREMNN
jgi:hypothetical protein